MAKSPDEDAAADRQDASNSTSSPGVGGPAAGASAPPERLDPAVADLVQRLEPFPALVKGRRWDVLAANPAARELFFDWSATRTTPT